MKGFRGGGGKFSDYKHMLAVLDYILRSAPDWTTGASGVGLVGLRLGDDQIRVALAL